MTTGESSPTAADLVLARDRLLGQGARSASPSGQSTQSGHRLAPDTLREALTDLHEFWLTAAAAQAGVGGRGGGVALLAVGGLGRRELVPYSDLDLVLVHDGRKAVDTIAERLWYPLWNSGVGLDHSVRTVGEALDVAKADLRTALGLLDARHLAGDAEVAVRLATSAREQWRTGVRNRLGDLIESVKQRWRRAGEVAHWVEPDLKHGRGGLRDLGILDALSLAQLIDRPGADVVAAHTLLLDTRTELRRIAGRPRDIVRPQDGDEIAAALGLADRFALARALSGAGRSVAYAMDVALRSTGAANGKRVLGLLRRTPDRRPLDEGVVLHGSEVALARDADPGKDPGLLLRVAAASGRTGHPIAPGALSRLSDHAPEPRAPWPAEVRQDLVSLLGAGEGLTDVVEALDRTGLWARLFPEWGAVRDLPPRDAAHIWTVDRHLVQTTVNASRMVTRVSRPDLLLIGALLHDLGKGRDQDHSIVGAALATQVGARLGLSKQDVDTLSAMVRHHLLLPHTATRRDVEDEATVLRVVDVLGGDPVLLELLHALAEADSLATGPGVWTDWKAALTTDLVTRCRAAMAGEQLPGPIPLSVAQTELAEAVNATGKADFLVDTSDNVATITLAAKNRPGVLSRAAGVLALNLLEVHAASLVTHAGVAVGVFSVTPRFGSMPDPALLREQFLRAEAGSLPLADKLAAKERDYGGRAEDAPEPRVLWFDHEAGDEDGAAVVLELRAADRIGLLHSVASALERCGIDVLWARVATMGGSAVDSFSFVPGKAPGWRQTVESAVLRASK
ncbi:UTP--GlnB (protein PII) uridylyltransferase, GlnD [Actinokineospora alba]|uniref:UTP--GlnB (Protein PII) uridylyltransferase, GlnD n=1 Tax=Actinokineospora alba TaxID=504798 RepID=A0A1H0I503_9PSEU|nr:[protein-PII] uridylyltransferase [Actinokineospora alba]TDP64610.1 UTP--GlnB (protein PII) uridylyltransferase GlnD [Actinokineospora alba]SDI85996.1 [protein-PII] uridylyltransferase [Actinokineospora alba]SDO26250.1 UTP--GlnB (protein PII) uridylyltransferase, GlnD [Actinokineospora alba]